MRIKYIQPKLLLRTKLRFGCMPATFVFKIQGTNLLSLYSRIVLFFIISFLILNCSSNDRIKKEELAKVYVDKLIVEEQYQKSDSLETKINEVFQKYSIAKKDYESAIKKLDYDKEQWEEFFTYSKNYLDTLKTNLDKKESAKKKIKKQKLKTNAKN